MCHHKAASKVIKSPEYKQNILIEEMWPVNVRLKPFITNWGARNFGRRNFTRWNRGKSTRLMMLKPIKSCM